MSNLIPSIRAAGSFEAKNPFNTVVDPSVYYTVEAIRTIPEMQALKLDIYKLVFKPVGVAEADYTTVVNNAINANAVVISLTSRNNDPVYVISTYLESFPLVDGVTYERMCIVADLGACPPALSEKINSALDHIKEYIKSSIGISSPTVTLGTIPTKGYVSKEQSEAWELARENQITSDPSDVVKLELANSEITKLQAYITQLETALKAKT